MTGRPLTGKSGSDEIVQWDSTDLMRRHMYWLAPGWCLFYALFFYGISKTGSVLWVAAAVLAIPAGLAFRWIENARATLLIGSIVGVWSLIGGFGIMAPLVFLSVTNRGAWMPWCALATAGTLLGFLLLRGRVSLAREWAGSLEGNREIDLDREQGRVRRMIMRRDEHILIGVSLAAIVVLVPAVYLTKGTPYYNTIAILIGPVLIALMMVDPAARLIAFYLVLRRWEVKNGIRLRFPPLPSQKEKERQIRKIAKLNRRLRGGRVVDLTADQRL